MTNPQPDQSHPTSENVPVAHVEASAAVKARSYLERAEAAVVGGFSAKANASSLATIGLGYALLAGLEARGVPSGLVFPPGTDPALVGALAAREARAEVEARPHDDEAAAEPGDDGLPLAVDEPSADAAPKPLRPRGGKAAGRG